MNIYSHTDIKNLFIVGDIHGEFKQLFHKIKTHSISKTDKDEQERYVDVDTLEKLESYLEDMPSYISGEFYNYSYGIGVYLGKLQDCIIIVAGDCGFGFNKEEYYHQIFKKYHETLEKNNIHIYFVRGNHDDPSYFNEKKIDYEFIKTIPDYSIISVNDSNILCVGGGLSIDRIWRKQQEVRINKYKKTIQKKLYWENEMPFFSKEKMDEINESGVKINIVVSHSSPHFVFPHKKDSLSYWAKLDKDIYIDSENERNVLTSVYEFLITNKHPLKSWYYGHFHCHNVSEKHKIKFYALNELGFAKVDLNNEEEENEFSLKDYFNSIVISDE